MRKIIFATLLSIMSLSLVAQTRLRVYFSDKGENLSLLENPSSFLSERSLERRTKQNLTVDQTDLPVSSNYLQQIRDRDFKIIRKSKWLNAALVEGEDIEALAALPFVIRVEHPRKAKPHFAGQQALQTNFDYGTAQTQVQMVNGEQFHQLGFTGEGVVIAVLDGGFNGTNTATAFDTLWSQGRILGSYNFVRNDTNVYLGGSHGTSVLSVMGANLPRRLVGTAPDAAFWLLTSENEASETPVEMDNWLAAAEFADSVGADVINSSLGYSVFDDPQDNYSYSDMDGNTTVVTKAADMAAAKGIMVVVSAGNEGGGSWQYITAPADGDSVLAVGAVDGQEQYVSFSSRGPSFDGRVKPDVVAMGAGTALVTRTGAVIGGFGTSFSSPVIAGMAACLIQAQPNRTVWQLMEQIKRSAHQYFNPDPNLGYGIPNFFTAYQLASPEYEIANQGFTVYPNPAEGALFVSFTNDNKALDLDLQISDLSGRMVLSAQHRQLHQEKLRIPLDLKKGIYLLQIKTGEYDYQQKLIIR